MKEPILYKDKTGHTDNGYYTLSNCCTQKIKIKKHVCIMGVL